MTIATLPLDMAPVCRAKLCRGKAELLLSVAGRSILGCLKFKFCRTISLYLPRSSSSSSSSSWSSSSWSSSCHVLLFLVLLVLVLLVLVLVVVLLLSSFSQLI